MISVGHVGTEDEIEFFGSVVKFLLEKVSSCSIIIGVGVIGISVGVWRIEIPPIDVP